MFLLKHLDRATIASALLLILIPLTNQTSLGQNNETIEKNFNLDLGSAREVNIDHLSEKLGSNPNDYVTLRDWSYDGRLILISQGLTLGVMDADATEITRLQFSVNEVEAVYNVSKNILVNDIRINQAKFSILDTNIIYVVLHYVHTASKPSTNNPGVAIHEDLFVFNQTDGSIDRLYESVKPDYGWIWIDVMPDHRRLLVRDSYELSILDVTNQSSLKLGGYSGIFPYDLSQDGTKLLSRGKNKEFEVFDLKTNVTEGYSLKPTRSFDNKPFVGQASWAPNNNYVVYSYGMIPFEQQAPWWANTVAVQSLDGSITLDLKKPGDQENIIIGNMVLSPYGDSLLIKGDCCGPPGIYRLDLARPIPEVGIPILFVAAVGLVIALTISRGLGACILPRRS